MSELPRLLPWDSEFFSFHVARIDAADEIGLRDSDRWCSTHGVRVAYLQVCARDPVLPSIAESIGFELFGVRVELVHTVVPSGDAGDDRACPSKAVRVAGAGDHAALAAMARVSHRDTRFHADPRFPIAQAEALYAEWIVRACERPECTVVVYDTGDGPLGYLASVRRDADVEVELLAVQPARRGQGIGSALLDSAVAASRHHGARRIVLATDAVNRVALQMYESKGFRPARTDLSYHKWYS